MNKEQKKLSAVKEAIHQRLEDLYKTKELIEEVKTLEYLMCLIEADPDSPDYAHSCLISMYK